MGTLILVLFSLFISYFIIYTAVRHAIDDSKLVRLLEEKQNKDEVEKDEQPINDKGFSKNDLDD